MKVLGFLRAGLTWSGAEGAVSSLSISGGLLKTSGPVTSRSKTNFVGSWSLLLPSGMLTILKFELLIKSQYTIPHKR